MQSELNPDKAKKKKKRESGKFYYIQWLIKKKKKEKRKRQREINIIINYDSYLKMNQQRESIFWTIASQDSCILNQLVYFLRDGHYEQRSMNSKRKQRSVEQRVIFMHFITVASLLYDLSQKKKRKNMIVAVV